MRSLVYWTNKIVSGKDMSNYNNNNNNKTTKIKMGSVPQIFFFFNDSKKNNKTKQINRKPGREGCRKIPYQRPCFQTWRNPGRRCQRKSSSRLWRRYWRIAAHFKGAQGYRLLRCIFERWKEICIRGVRKHASVEEPFDYYYYLKKKTWWFVL